MSTAFVLSLFLFLNSALAVKIPFSNCDKYFSYTTVKDGNEFIGIFTANKAHLKKFYWEAKFSSIGADLDEVGILRPYPSEEGLLANIQYGHPAQMYVKFINIVNELPLLTHFALNNETLCTNTRYAPPSTSVRVAQSIQINSPD